MALRVRGASTEDMIPGGTLTPTVLGSGSSVPADLNWVEAPGDNTGRRFSNATTTPTNYLSLGVSLNAFIASAMQSSWVLRFRFRVNTAQAARSFYAFGTAWFWMGIGTTAAYLADPNTISFHMSNTAQNVARRVNGNSRNYADGEWHEVAVYYNHLLQSQHNAGVTGNMRIFLDGVELDYSSYTSANSAQNAGAQTTVDTSSAFLLGGAFGQAGAANGRTADSGLEVAYLTITTGRTTIREAEADIVKMYLLSIGDDRRPFWNAGPARALFRAAEVGPLPTLMFGDSTLVGDINVEDIGGSPADAYKIGHFGGWTRVLADKFGGLCGIAVGTGAMAGSLPSPYDGVTRGGFGVASAAYSAMPQIVRNRMVTGLRFQFTGGSWNDTTKVLTLPQSLLDSGYVPRAGDWISITAPPALVSGSGNYVMLVSGSGATWTGTRTNGTAVTAGGDQTGVAGSPFNADTIPPLPFYLADGGTIAAATASSVTFTPRDLLFDFSRACVLRVLAVGVTAGSGAGVLRLRLTDGVTNLAAADIATKGPAPSTPGTITEQNGAEWIAPVSIDIPAGVRLNTVAHALRLTQASPALTAAGPGGVLFWQLYHQQPKGCSVSVAYAGGGLSNRTVLGYLLNTPIEAIELMLREVTEVCAQAGVDRRLVVWWTTGENDDQQALSIPPDAAAGAPVTSLTLTGERHNFESAIRRLEAAWARLGGKAENLVVIKDYHPSVAAATRLVVKGRAVREVAQDRIGRAVAQVAIIRPDFISSVQQAIADGAIPASDTAHPFYDWYEGEKSRIFDLFLTEIEAIEGALTGSAGGSSGGAVRAKGGGMKDAREAVVVHAEITAASPATAPAASVAVNDHGEGSVRAALAAAAAGSVYVAHDRLPVEAERVVYVGAAASVGHAGGAACEFDVYAVYPGPVGVVNLRKAADLTYTFPLPAVPAGTIPATSIDGGNGPRPALTAAVAVTVTADAGFTGAGQAGTVAALGAAPAEVRVGLPEGAIGLLVAPSAGNVGAGQGVRAMTRRAWE